MASSRNIVSILVVCATLAITLGQVQHGIGYSHQSGAHHDQIRIRRQVADEVEQENTVLQDLEQENAAAENAGQESQALENQDEANAGEEKEEIEDDAATDVEEENAIAENAGQENQALENQEEENAGEDGGLEDDATTDVEEENVTEDIEEGTTPAVTYPFWTTCDFGMQPIKSCYDCNSLLVCKRVGGLVQPCWNPLRPHCNNGFCSPVPSAGCA